MGTSQDDVEISECYPVKLDEKKLMECIVLGAHCPTKLKTKDGEVLKNSCDLDVHYIINEDSFDSFMDVYTKAEDEDINDEVLNEKILNLSQSVNNNPIYFLKVKGMKTSICVNSITFK